MTLEQLIDRLSAIEPDEGMFDGIGEADIPRLEKLVRHPEWIAPRAIFALSKVSHPGAMAVLRKATRDQRVDVRTAVAASLSNISSLEVIEAEDMLLRLLNDSDLGVQKFAIRAVGKNHGEEVRRKLMNLKATPIGALATNKLRELGIDEL